MSSKEIPVMKERYDGTRGKTQGERKESNPPPKATAIERFSADSIAKSSILNVKKGVNDSGAARSIRRLRGWPNYGPPRRLR